MNIFPSTLETEFTLYFLFVKAVAILTIFSTFSLRMETLLYAILVSTCFCSHHLHTVILNPILKSTNQSTKIKLKESNMVLFCIVDSNTGAR